MHCVRGDVCHNAEGVDCMYERCLSHKETVQTPGG